MTRHTLLAFDAELKELYDLVVRMGDAASKALRSSNDALKSGDLILARRVIEADRQIDELQAQVVEKAISVIARRQPVADDLRAIVSLLKIVTDIERIGDLAKNNAGRVLRIARRLEQNGISAIMERLGWLVVDQVEKVLGAFAKRDDRLAHEVWMRDSEVDMLHTSLFRELLTYMMEDPRKIGTCAHLLFCARNLERIGDHATNIAEDVHYIVVGKRMPLERPKGEDISDLAP